MFIIMSIDNKHSIQSTWTTCRIVLVLVIIVSVLIAGFLSFVLYLWTVPIKPTNEGVDTIEFNSDISASENTVNIIVVDRAIYSSDYKVTVNGTIVDMINATEDKTPKGEAVTFVIINWNPIAGEEYKVMIVDIATNELVGEREVVAHQ